jgi:hypothetical protein
MPRGVSGGNVRGKGEAAARDIARVSDQGGSVVLGSMAPSSYAGLPVCVSASLGRVWLNPQPRAACLEEETPFEGGSPNGAGGPREDA